jgi:hypothetical protein
MAVVAKFQVNSVELFAHGPSRKVKLGPVYAGPGADPQVTSKEDGAFWQATPQGSLEMVIDNPDASEQFQPGDKFYLTFERVPDASD